MIKQERKFVEINIVNEFSAATECSCCSNPALYVIEFEKEKHPEEGITSKSIRVIPICASCLEVTESVLIQALGSDYVQRQFESEHDISS